MSKDKTYLYSRVQEDRSRPRFLNSLLMWICHCLYTSFQIHNRKGVCVCGGAQLCLALLQPHRL